MSEIKLLPCPFCGGENIKVLGAETSYYWCRCMNCLASTTTEDVEEDAIKAWNTRKPIEKVVKELEEWSFETEIVIPSSDGYDETATRQIICTRNAIDIVRGSGLNEHNE